MQKLVSVIIPCFNAERWLRQAIDSCLQQSYPHVEVIVIDDGSTDRSLEIMQDYQGQIIWETGPNQGGNVARNRGLQLARGAYIQYLDADDYLLPEKLTQQVQALETTGADVVYSDLIYQHHGPGGATWQSPAYLMGTPAPYVNVLESLLTYGSLSPSAHLLRREIVSASGGWDEALKAGQDTDFFLSVVFSGARFHYLPGVYSVYRRYGNVTVSTSSRMRLVCSFCVVLDKAKQKLERGHNLSDQYRWAIARSYINLLTTHWRNLDWNLVLQLIWRILSLIRENTTAKLAKAYTQLLAMLVSGKQWASNSLSI